MRWITSVSTVVEIIIKVLLLIILVVVGTVLIVGLIRLGRADSKSIAVASCTASGADTREDKSGGLGHDIADALEFELLRIAQLHTLTNPWGSPKELPSLQMTGPQTVERVGGTISVAGVELPVEMVVEILKPLLARPRTQYLITGNFQKVRSGDGTWVKESGNTEEEDACLRFPSGEGTRVRIIVRLEADRRMLKRWNCKSLLPSVAEHNAENRASLAWHLREIAYEVMWIVLEGVEANSLQNFKDFIQGVDSFREYKDKKYEAFGKAESLLSKAAEKNPAYARAYFYFGNLYSWRAYYEKDDDGVERMYEQKARNMYNLTAMRNTAKPHEAGAMSKFGMGLLDYRRYRKAKDQGKPLDVQLLERANQAFTAAWKEDPEFYLARTGNALVYKEEAELLKKPEKKKEREGYLNRAIGEFQYAKAVAADLKDADSVKWLDRQILELEFKKREWRDTSKLAPPSSSRSSNFLDFPTHEFCGSRHPVATSGRKRLPHLTRTFLLKGYLHQNRMTHNSETVTDNFEGYTGCCNFSHFRSSCGIERDIIRERTNAGLQSARVRGRLGGRPKALNARQVQMLQSLAGDKTNSVDEICRTLKISRPTFYRYVNTFAI